MSHISPPRWVEAFTSALQNLDEAVEAVDKIQIATGPWKRGIRGSPTYRKNSEIKGQTQAVSQALEKMYKNVADGERLFCGGTTENDCRYKAFVYTKLVQGIEKIQKTPFVQVKNANAADAQTAKPLPDLRAHFASQAEAATLSARIFKKMQQTAAQETSSFPPSSTLLSDLNQLPKLIKQTHNFEKIRTDADAISQQLRTLTAIAKRVSSLYDPAVFSQEELHFPPCHNIAKWVFQQRVAALASTTLENLVNIWRCKSSLDAILPTLQSPDAAQALASVQSLTTLLATYPGRVSLPHPTPTERKTG